MSREKPFGHDVEGFCISRINSFECGSRIEIFEMVRVGANRIFAERVYLRYEDTIGLDSELIRR